MEASNGQSRRKCGQQSAKGSSRRRECVVGALLPASSLALTAVGANLSLSRCYSQLPTSRTSTDSCRAGISKTRYLHGIAIPTTLWLGASRQRFQRHCELTSSSSRLLCTYDHSEHALARELQAHLPSAGRHSENAPPLRHAKPEKARQEPWPG